MDSGREDPRAVAARLALVVGRVNRRLRPSGPGLSHGVLSALATLVREGPMRPGELSKIENVTAPAITRLVGRLETEGLVRRVADPEDGRSFFVEPTRRGTDTVLEARSERAERAYRLLGHLDRLQYESIIVGLSALEELLALGDGERDERESVHG